MTELGIRLLRPEKREAQPPILTSLQSKYSFERRKNKVGSLRRWADYAKNAIAKAEEIETKRIRAKAYEEESYPQDRQYHPQDHRKQNKTKRKTAFTAITGSE